MSFLTRAAGFGIAGLLLAGAYMIASTDSVLVFDTGMTFIVTGLSLLIIESLVHNQTRGNAKTLTTPGNRVLYAAANLALFGMMVGEIVYRHLEFTRAHESDWAVKVGVPAFDGIFEYVIALVPFNFVLYMLLKWYQPGVGITTRLHNLRHHKNINIRRLVGFGSVMLLGIFGFAAAFSASNFYYVSAMILTCTFAFFLFVGSVDEHEPNRGNKSHIFPRR